MKARSFGGRLIRTMGSLLFAGAVAVCASPRMVRADDSASAWKYWLGAGAAFFESDESTESGQLYELRVGYDLNPRLTLEAGVGGSPFFEGNDFNAPDPKEATFNGRNSPGENWLLKTNLSALYHLNSAADKKLDPYLSVIGGVGYFGKRREDNRNWEAFGGPGVGVSYWIKPTFAVRADYNLVVMADEPEFNHFALLMAYYKFGGNGSTGGEGSGADKGDEMGAKSSGPLKPIYFDFDKSNITGSAATTLQENADWMKKNPDKKVSLEGHCDERGTNEYNLALGARRANSAQDYLRNLGIPKDQMSTISYGEELPADPGHNEAAWSKNRRVESVVKK